MTWPGEQSLNLPFVSSHCLRIFEIRLDSGSMWTYWSHTWRNALMASLGRVKWHSIVRAHCKSNSLSVPAVFFFFCKKKKIISHFAAKMQNFASWMRQILRKFCNVFTQPNFFLCNANTADVHPQSPIFFLN